MKLLVVAMVFMCIVICLEMSTIYSLVAILAQLNTGHNLDPDIWIRIQIGIGIRIIIGIGIV